MNGQARTPYGIVVGYDGSAGSQLALGWAAETARQQGKQLTLVHSVNVAAVPAYPAMDLAELEPSLEHVAKALVDQGAERAGGTLEPSQIETQYWLGSPVRCAGVASVKVVLVWEPPWDKDRMSEAAKLQLGIDDY